MTLEALGLGAYEARERADLFRRFNLQMVEEMAAGFQCRLEGFTLRGINASLTQLDIVIDIAGAGDNQSGRMTLEALGLGAYEARERADLFRRFNLQMVEERRNRSARSRASYAPSPSASRVIRPDFSAASKVSRSKRWWRWRKTTRRRGWRSSSGPAIC
jgi:hypothetical protein